MLDGRQQELLERIRAAAKGLVAGKPLLEGDRSLLSDHFLLRYCRARQWKESQVLEMLTAHLTWMEHWDPVKLMSKPCPELSFVKRFYPTGYHGVDKLGRPIYIECLGKLDVARLMQHVTYEQLVENFIRESERQLRLRFPACCLVSGTIVDRSLNIIDLSGLSFRLVTHSLAKKLVKEIASISQNHYPEICGQIVVINCPKIFSMAWSSLKSMLDENTIRKIAIYSADQGTEALLKLVDKDQLPEFLGGGCRCPHSGGCLEQGPGPWNRPDVLAHIEAHPDNHWKALTVDGSRALLNAADAKQMAMESGSSIATAAVAASASDIVSESAIVISESFGGDIAIANGLDSLDGNMPTSKHYVSPAEVVEDMVLVAGESFVSGTDAGGRSPPFLNAGSAADGSDSEEERFGVIIERPVTEAERAAKQELEELLRAHEELEAKQLATLVDWAQVSRKLVEEVGRPVIERSQRYYDARTISIQTNEEYANALQSVSELKEQLAKLAGYQESLEEAFHAFLEDPTKPAGVVSEAEWSKMLPHSPQCPADFQDGGKLMRVWRMAAVSDYAHGLKRKLAPLQEQVERLCEEAASAQHELELQEAKHQYCTWNCSVRRAEAYFEKRNAHEVNIDIQSEDIKRMEQRIACARSRVAAAEAGAAAAAREAGNEMDGAPHHRKTLKRSNSITSIKSVPASAAEYDVAEFHSCSEPDDNCGSEGDA